MSSSPGSEAMEKKTPTPREEARLLAITRRHFFERCSVGLGSLALVSLLAEEGFCSGPGEGQASLFPGAEPFRPRGGHFPGRAKSVIYLFMAGGPSQLELFDDKPMLRQLDGKTVPASYVENKRFA